MSRAFSCRCERHWRYIQRGDNACSAMARPTRSDDAVHTASSKASCARVGSDEEKCTPGEDRHIWMIMEVQGGPVLEQEDAHRRSAADLGHMHV
jgi:hypothetical protein